MKPNPAMVGGWVGGKIENRLINILNLGWEKVGLKQNYDYMSMPRNMPATTEVATAPAILGPMACINRKFLGFAS